MSTNCGLNNHNTSECRNAWANQQSD